MKLNGDMERLDEILAYVKGEVKAFDEKEGTVSIEMKDTNRADLWSVEGLSRALQGYLNNTKGLKQYAVGKSVVEVDVDAQLAFDRSLAAHHQKHQPFRHNHPWHYALAGQA